jgi:transcriptional regulator GlxA family with amidase domain
MKSAFIIFDRMTMLEFISIYDPLTRLKLMGLMPEFAWGICARSKNVVDGGLGTRRLQYDKGFIDWLRTSEPVKLKASVCTSALLLGAAGFLKLKRVTTHPRTFEELKPYCTQVMMIA